VDELWSLIANAGFEFDYGKIEKLAEEIRGWHRRDIVKLVESCEEVEPVEKYVLIRKSEILSRAGVKK